MIDFLSHFRTQPLEEPEEQSGWKKVARHLIWLFAPLLILLLLFGCGWISLIGTSTVEPRDTRSELEADYSAWPSLTFRRVHPSVLFEIERETGRRSEIRDVRGEQDWFWSTPTPVMPNPTPSIPSNRTPVVVKDKLPKPTFTPTPTPASTATFTVTATPVPSQTPTATATPSMTATPTHTASASPSSSNTPTPSDTPTATMTPTASDTPTLTPSLTNTATATDTATATPTPTNTPTQTPTSGVTNTPTPTPTPTPVPFINCDYSYRKLITLQSSQVTADMTNFPVLVNLPSDTDLAANALNSGDDLVFTADDGTSVLSFEIEKFDGTSGELVAWVDVPTLSSSVDTDVYLYYGNASATDRQNPNGVWDANYVGVWHLDEAGSGNMYEYFDSTAGDNHGQGGKGFASYVPSQAEGQIGEGQSFDGVNDFIDMASSGWADAAWPYRRRLVIDGSQVSGSAKLQSFPVLIHSTLPDWRDTANGGHVGKGDGTDIFFTSDEGGKLDHELEHYDPTSGQVVAWVEVSLSPNENTTIYMYYGNGAAADQQNVAGAWDEAGSGNFRGVWHLPEDPSSAAPQFLNSAINGYDGTANSLASSHQIPGRIDGSLAFDDTNERHVDVPNSAGLQLASDITVSAWIRTTDAEADTGVVAAKWGASGDRNYWLGKSNGTDLAFNVDDTQAVTTGLNLVNDGSWHHVAAVADAAGTSLRIFVDGVQQNTAGYSGTSETGTGDLHIGNSPDIIAREFDGGIDEVRVAATARSADWIVTEFNNQNNPDGFYQVLDEEQPSDVELDLTGNQITLESWVKFDGSAADNMGVLTKNGWADGYRINIEDPGREVSFQLTGTSYNLVTSGTLTADPDWHHVVTTYDGSTMRVYLDGSQDPTTMAKSDDLDTAGKEFWIGHGDHAIERIWSYPFFGVLDEIRVSGTARSASWISTSYNNQSSPGTFHVVAAQESWSCNTPTPTPTATPTPTPTS